MESKNESIPVTKLIIAFFAVIIVGFIIVAFSEKSEEEKLGEAFVRNVGLLNKFAQDKCTAAVKEHTGAQVYSPSDSASDNETYVTLTWKGSQGAFDTAVCKYEKDKGITRLAIDGKTVVSK